MIDVRPAGPTDAPTVYRFIRELADYEREPDAVKVSAAELAEQMGRDQPPFECVLGLLDGAPVGFALFFHNYSTWRGRAGLYLEDLYVSPAARGAGVGRRLLQHLARVAVARDCARMEWAVLDWNTPAIEFYERLGAAPMSDWTTYRLTDDALRALADST